MCIISWGQVVPSYWGTKGATAVLFLIIYRHSPLTTFFINQGNCGGFLADCIIQKCKRKRAVWEDEEGFLGSHDCCVFAQHAAPSHLHGGGKVAPCCSIGYLLLAVGFEMLIRKKLIMALK